METINLAVSGMTCGSCVKHVEQAIQSIVGVQRVEVDLALGAVKIQGDVSQSLPAIIAALEAKGYPSTVNTDRSNKASSGSCKTGGNCCSH